MRFPVLRRFTRGLELTLTGHRADTITAEWKGLYRMMGLSALLTIWLAAAPELQSELVFPYDAQHNHAPGIAELPDGSLFVSWYRGSGERRADDVAVFGSRKSPETGAWSPAKVLVDTPGFPDCNTTLMTDAQGALWLFWPVVIANSWESCLTNYQVATAFDEQGLPVWGRRGAIYLKPDDFSPSALTALDGLVKQLPIPLPAETQQKIDVVRSRLTDKLYQRLGWQPRCKPTVLPTGRILLPLYSDTFSISLMAISDDQGESWYASGPLLGFGNIQPTVLRRRNGALVAYMRENGFTDRIRVSESTDDGLTWGTVTSSDLPNPGAGIDGVVLADGRWVLIYNDTVKGRNSLAVSMSDDEGVHWKWTRHLEHHAEGSYHYPAIIQGRDGRLHAVYSYFVSQGKSMKHAAFTPDWISADGTSSDNAAPK
jgi:predicted neuraminidase